MLNFKKLLMRALKKYASQELEKRRGEIVARAAGGGTILGAGIGVGAGGGQHLGRGYAYNLLKKNQRLLERESILRQLGEVSLEDALQALSKSKFPESRRLARKAIRMERLGAGGGAALGALITLPMAASLLYPVFRRKKQNATYR